MVAAVMVGHWILTFCQTFANIVQLQLAVDYQQHVTVNHTLANYLTTGTTVNDGGGGSRSSWKRSVAVVVVIVI